MITNTSFFRYPSLPEAPTHYSQLPPNWSPWFALVTLFQEYREHLNFVRKQMRSDLQTADSFSRIPFELPKTSGYPEPEYFTSIRNLKSPSVYRERQRETQTHWLVAYHLRDLLARCLPPEDVVKATENIYNTASDGFRHRLDRLSLSPTFDIYPVPHLAMAVFHVPLRDLKREASTEDFNRINSYWLDLWRRILYLAFSPLDTIRGVNHYQAGLDPEGFMATARFETIMLNINERLLMGAPFAGQENDHRMGVGVNFRLYPLNMPEDEQP